MEATVCALRSRDFAKEASEVIVLELTGVVDIRRLLSCDSNLVTPIGFYGFKLWCP